MGIKIYYNNWDINDETSTASSIARCYGGHTPFNEGNYRWVANEEVVTPIDFELRFISDSNKEEEYYLDMFQYELDRIWCLYNDNIDHEFRSMCVGDIIEFSTSIISIKFVVKEMGFGLTNE